MSTQAQAVAIGASAGALEALFSILPNLPKNYPLAIFVVVHLPAHKPSLLPELLAQRVEMRVVEAEDKMRIEPGCIYVAPPNYHMLVGDDYLLALSNEEEIMFSRPSVDVLFESAADVYGDGLIALVLTGANADGAQGLRAVCTEGGRALVQDPESCYARAMPEAALLACPEALKLSLPGIAQQLREAA